MNKYIKIKNQLDKRSNFFCPAKWTELYLYLNHGNTNSCSHPIPHKIPKELLNDPYVLHNTPHKLKQQELMIEGKRPDECHMCWHIEDSNSDALSDRFVKGFHWKDDIDILKVDPHTVPKFIEVVFDNLCNLTCSYCDSGQSSSWTTKLKQQTVTLKTDYRQLYSKIHIKSNFIDQEYYEAWLKWWEEIRNKVHVLKISGGEPLISNNFWNFFEVLGDAPQLVFSINSNFMVNESRIQKLIDKSLNFKSVVVAVSIDGKNDISEYTRKGMKYDQVLNNIKYWCENSPENCVVSLQSTVNIFSIWGFADFLDLCAELRLKYPKKIHTLYSTLVRFPEFQNISLLPKSMRLEIYKNIDFILNKNFKIFDETEIVYINKILSYLQNDPQRMTDAKTSDLLIDLVSFIDYYDSFGGKKSFEVFPQEFLFWVKNISKKH